MAFEHLPHQLTIANHILTEQAQDEGLGKTQLFPSKFLKKKKEKVDIADANTGGNYHPETF